MLAKKLFLLVFQVLLGIYFIKFNFFILTNNGLLFAPHPLFPPPSQHPPPCYPALQLFSLHVLGCRGLSGPFRIAIVTGGEANSGISRNGLITGLRNGTDSITPTSGHIQGQGDYRKTVYGPV